MNVIYSFWLFVSIFNSKTPKNKSTKSTCLAILIKVFAGKQLATQFTNKTESETRTR